MKPKALWLRMKHPCKDCHGSGRGFKCSENLVGSFECPTCRGSGVKLKTPQIKPQAQRKAIKRVSKTKSKRDVAYNARVKVWLNEMANKYCECCIARNSVKSPNRATNCHHIYGRGWKNELLMREEFWLPCCSDCHPAWIDANRDLARELGLLAPKGQWNNPPKTPCTDFLPY